MKLLTLLLALLTFTFITGCSQLKNEKDDVDITIDGSSTVYPISEVAVQSYLQNAPDVNISLKYSGTSSGIHKLCTGAIDIANASRKITAEETHFCKENDVAYLELLIAKDGIAVAVHANNIWVDYLTVSELQKIWHANSEGIISKWSDIRDGWPDHKIKLYGPGSASGTYGYFADTIIGDHATRGDYVASENDEILVEGVSENLYGLGFFGLGYYRDSNKSLKLVPIEDDHSVNSSGPTIPSSETINNGSYQPLTRNMYIYVAEHSLKKQSIIEFADFFLHGATGFISKAGYIPQPETVYKSSLNHIRTSPSTSN